MYHPGVDVAQTGEDDAGYKGLKDFEQTWNGWEKSTDLTRFCSSQSNLNGIQDEGQKGENAATNLSVADRTSEEDGVEEGRHKHLRENQSPEMTEYLFCQVIYRLIIKL